MAHCEKPGCPLVAGVVRVVTPYGEPVVCDDHASGLRAMEGPWLRGLVVSERLTVAWLTYAMRSGPLDWPTRVRWLEGLPPLDLAA